MKLLVLGLIAGAILVYLIYNECWKVHRCTPFPNMEKMPGKRVYGGSTRVKRQEEIGDPKYQPENFIGWKTREGLEMGAKMPSFDEQADEEANYINERGDHFGHREDDPKGIMDMDTKLTEFKGLSKAGWEGTDKVDLSGKLRQLEKKVGKKVDETDMSRAQKGCIMATKCGDLTDDGKCGYCASSGAYTTSNKKGTGPLTDVCETGKYANSVKGCEKLQERQLCNSIVSCGDLYGEAANKCGYCPTTGKIMAMKKMGNKLLPKYKEDTCAYNGGLLKAADCVKFAKDHPCITPYHGTGKHSRDCYVKLWKNSGCKGTKPYNKPFDDLVGQKGQGYKEVGAQMKELYKKTESRDLVTVLKSYPLCHNKEATLDPCDQKYTQPYNDKTKEARKLCANKIWKGQGCDSAGKKNPERLSGGDKEGILKDIDNYKNTVQGYVQSANKEILNTREYAAKKAASQACYGQDPPKPDGIREGDYITMDWDGGVLWGYLLDYRSKKRLWGVMWTKYVKGGKDQRRMGMGQEEQKKWFGWPGRKATDPTRKSLGDNEGLVNGTKLTIKTRCSSGNSLCGRSCNSVLNNILDKYPPPQDCVVSKWSVYGKCTEECGGGKKTKTRKILYPPKRGGVGCPKLTHTIGCNFDPCINKNFTEATRPDVKGKSGVTHVQISKTGYVQVQEIEVYDQKGKIDLEGGSASSSSAYYWWFAPAKRVMDGNKKDYNRWWMSHRKGNSAHTKGGLDQWVRVKLPKKADGSNLYNVTKVVVYGRADCSWGNCGLKGAKIQLWNMNVKPAKLIEDQRMNDDRRQTYYFGAKENYYCKKEGGWCESKRLKVGDTAVLTKFKKACKSKSGKTGTGSCLEANFEKSKAYPKGGDCDWYGYRWHGWGSRNWPVSKCADICSKDKNCNRFTFGATNVYGGPGLGCRTSKTYNTGYCPITTDRYKSNGWRWWGTSNFWGGQVYDKKGKPPKKDMQYVGDFQDCGDNWWMNKYALNKRWRSPYGDKLTKDYKVRTQSNSRRRGKWARDLSKYKGRTAYWGPGNDARVCQWRCKDYKYFGLQWYGMCFCSNTFGRYFQHHDKGHTKDEGRKKGDVWRRQSYPRRVNWWWSYYGGCRNRVFAGPKANPEVLADNKYGRPNPQPPDGSYGKGKQWSHAGKEGEQMDTKPLRGLVRYGAKDRWVYRSARDSWGGKFTCNSASFGGDPNPGAKKTCMKLKSW